MRALYCAALLGLVPRPATGFAPRGFAPRLQQSPPRAPLRLVPDWVTPDEVVDFAAKQGPVAFGVAHAGAIILCLPITPLFEVAAGAVFGVPVGVLTVWIAKCCAAIATFGIASVAPSARLAEAADRLFAEQPRLQAMSDDVQAEGRLFTILARLSPVPSWANNYGLALCGVRFEDYLPGTIFATLPAVVAHVCVGASLSELTSGGASSPALGALGAASAAILFQRLASAPGRRRPEGK